MSVYHHHKDFYSSGCFASDPVTTATPTRPYRDKCIYNIHCSGENLGISSRAGVYELSGLCPPFCASNSNVFVSTFGVEYEADGVTIVRPISAYEIACCFRIDSDLTYEIYHPANFCLLDCGVPSWTSAVLLDAILKRLDKIRNENLEIFYPSCYSYPAAIPQVPDFTNGAVGSRISENKVWQKSLKDDPITTLLLEIVAKTALGDDQKYIQSLHSIYRQP